MPKEMSCTAAQALLWEAELAELRGSDTPLGGHITQCPDCRRRAEIILHGWRDLDAGLASFAAVPPRSKAFSIVPLRSKAFKFFPLPLAAAAVLALMLTRQQEQPFKEPTFLAQLMTRAEPVVTPPAGKQAIVMERSDFTVVWLY